MSMRGDGVANLLLATGWPMVAGPAVVFAIGVGYLVRFLKLYPKPSPEVANASA